MQQGTTDTGSRRYIGYKLLFKLLSGSAALLAAYEAVYFLWLAPTFPMPDSTAGASPDSLPVRLFHNQPLTAVMGSLLLFVLLLVALGFLYHVQSNVVRFVTKAMDLMAHHEYDPESLPAVRPWMRENMELTALVREVVAEQQFMEQIKQVAGRGYVIEDVLENLFRHMQPHMPVDRIDIAYVNRVRGSITIEHAVTGYSPILLAAGHSCRMDDPWYAECLFAGRSFVSSDLSTETGAGRNRNTDAINLLVREGILSGMMFPLFLSGSVYAFLFFGAREKDRFGAWEQMIGRNTASELSFLLDKTLLTKTMFSTITTSFSELVDRKDNETADHINRMVAYSSLLAGLLTTHPNGGYRINNRFVRDITNHAAIHDIGKVAIPDAILKKNGKLTPEEWEIMKTHASIGSDILLDMKRDLTLFRQDFYEVATNIARHHHERWDGTGYPDALKGDDIPLEARIVAVADVFDALSSKRVYKEAWSFEDSLLELRASAGSHLDPVLVGLFLEHEAEIRIIHRRNGAAKSIMSA